jgi:RNA polymerase sigma-70 factor (sigma-E family)
VTVDLREERVDATPQAEGHGSFEEFVAGTAGRMTRLAMLLTGDRHATEDLVQATYAQVFARWRQVRRADHPAAYTRTILTRLYLAQQRRRRVTEVRWDDGLEIPAHPVDPALRLSLIDALATLSPTDRSVLVLRYFQDVPVAEVARQLGLSEGACRTRASRALSRLRVHFPDLAE